MVQIHGALETLRLQGDRITVVKRAIIEILSQAEKPLSVLDMQKKLKAKKLLANKTTVYRQLNILVRYRLVHEIRLNERTKRYELSKKDDHHHHLVCMKCDVIEDISFKDDLLRQEKKILKKSNFKVLQHSLEFYGLCKKCHG